MLGDAHSSTDFGEISWPNVLCLAVAWALVFFAIGKGLRHTVKASGESYGSRIILLPLQVVYYTATLPYAFFLSLILMALSIDGRQLVRHP